MTISEALQYARIQLTPVSDAPDIDANRLLLFTLQQPTESYLVTNGATQLSETGYQDFLTVLERRKNSEPLAYILGTWEFYGREFIVSPSVLIPRPDTENLIDVAKEYIEKIYQAKQAPLTIADIGTGSGCIAITLALECPDAIRHVIAVDISADALAIANQNITRYQLDSVIQTRLGDLLDPLEHTSVNLIVSNPPYIPSSELSKPLTITTKGLTFEPKLALDGGQDGQHILNELKKSNLPTIVEVTGGTIETWNLDGF